MTTSNAFQVLVRHVHGYTVCIPISSSHIRGSDLKQTLSIALKIPANILRVTCGRYDVADNAIFHSDDAGTYPSCSLSFRLAGGKGGFGSLLRGAATKAGQKKTRNFDACRDMSGRRLRHVNAEKKLMDWKATEKDRELEKLGEEYLRKLSKDQRALEREKPSKGVVRDSNGEPSSSASGNVNASIQVGLVEAKKQQDLKKRKAAMDAAESKKLRIMSMLEEVGVSDDEDDSEASEGEGEERGGEDGEDEREDVDGNQTASLLVSQGEEIGQEEVIAPENKQAEDEPETKEVQAEELKPVKAELSTKDPIVLNVELDLALFDSPASLEKLGLDRLKAELQKKGLKFGGNLSERAARLFLLKESSVDRIDKKHLPKCQGKK